MIDNILKYCALLPILAILVYILGYLGLSGYWESYGISPNAGLDLKILGTGTLLMFIIVPPIIFCCSDFKIGDYSNATPTIRGEVIDTLHDALGYTILFAISLSIYLFGLSYDISTIVLLIFLIAGVSLNRVNFTSKTRVILKLILINLPFWVFLVLLIVSGTSGRTSLYFLLVCTFTTCMLFRILNKEGLIFQTSRIGIFVTTILFTGNLFGSFILGEIPLKYGGQLMGTKLICFERESLMKLKNTSLAVQLDSNTCRSLRKIYQDNDYIYVLAGKTKIVSFPRSFVIGEESDVPKGYR